MGGNPLRRRNQCHHLQETIESLEDAFMSLALGKRDRADCTRCSKATEFQTIIEELRRARRREFYRVVAELLVNPCPPIQGHTVAGFKHAFRALGRGTAHQTKVSAVIARQGFKDGGVFPKWANSKDNGFIRPIHSRNRQQKNMRRATA
jgi:hypothetical protein